MIHMLVEKLETMNGKNVDITVENEKNGILMSISTEGFCSDVDEFYITLDNDCKDCNFDIRLPITNIIDVDLENFDDGMIIVSLTSGLQYIITMI